MLKTNIMNLKTIYIILGIVCYIITYAADCLMDSSKLKGAVIIVSSASACFSFLKAMVYGREEKQ